MFMPPELGEDYTGCSRRAGVTDLLSRQPSRGDPCPWSSGCCSALRNPRHGATIEPALAAVADDQTAIVYRGS